MYLRVARETQEETVFGIENLLGGPSSQLRPKHHLVHLGVLREQFSADPAPRVTFNEFAPYSPDDGVLVVFLSPSLLPPRACWLG